MAYTVKFAFYVGEKAFDLLTKEEVTILGIFYGNGRNCFNNQSFFHSITYFTDSKEFEGVRREEDLMKI